MAVSTYTRLHNFLRVACAGCQKRLLHMGQSLLGHNDSVSGTEQKAFTVAIEGNIGCGKSTLLQYFSPHPVVQAMQEPVGKWTNVHGHNALQLLYEDPSRWSFAFNNYVMLTRLKIHSLPHTAPVKMIERSLHSTYHVFVENSFRMGSISGLEYSILGTWFDYLFSLPATQLDLIVYLRTAPEVCYERMRKRDRWEESGVPLTFVTDLHILYEEWLTEKKDLLPAPVLIIDADKDLDTMYEVYKERSSELLCGCQ